MTHNGHSGFDRRTFIRGSAAAGAALAFGGLPLTALGQDRRLASIGGIAKTHAGRVRGLLRDGVHQFWCVPYGAPTWGANRFMPPQPPVPWSGVKDHFEITFAAPDPLIMVVAAPAPRTVRLLSMKRVSPASE